jgi:C1A family cysteine protease
MVDYSHLVGFWLGDEEDRDHLEATSSPMPELMYAAPDEVDPRKLFSSHRWVENQASQGSCAGHANTTILEYCLGVATQKEPVHLSRQYSYITAQKKSGISGDRGSTIDGNVRTAVDGIPEEPYWPYTGKYHTSPPGGWEPARENAKNYRLAKHSVLRSYQDCFDWIASGAGAVNIGIRWGVPDSPICENYNNSGGGHAVALIGYSKRVDSQGRKYLWLLNSWGQNWGNGGWCEVAPRAIEQMFQSNYTVMIGMTDMQNIVPRPITIQLDWL